MARNYEKNFGRLNRLWLEKESAKKAKRPKLSTLKTAAEVSEWLPDLKHEIDFFLKQMEVPCYTEKKISECKRHIVHLEQEYKSFLRKLRKLDSSISVAPWTPRPYEKRKDRCEVVPQLHPVDKMREFTKIDSLQTPVLMHDSLYRALEHQIGNSIDSHGLPESNQSMTPLVIPGSFGKSFSQPSLEVLGSSIQSSKESSTEKLPKSHTESEFFGVAEKKVEEEENRSSLRRIEKEKNVLGLCYSSSDED